jgi:agmatine/peptidylarginine deiminase
MGNSFTFALEPKRMIMEKYLVNPNDSDAFSSEVMHKVVLNGIDFELPEHIWDAIDDAFGNYWNIEVGYGGWPDLNSAVSSISNWLQKKNIIFSIDKIVTIVNVMFDWIEKIPGAILDDNEVVVPHSFEETEKLRQEIKRQKRNLKVLLKTLSDIKSPNFNDTMTNFVYISDKLKEFYPRTYSRLTKLFDDMEIEWGEIEGTKDIWIRDYMPIQISSDSFVVYNYNPDYLKDSGVEYITDSQAIADRDLKHCNKEHFDITLDGGNVVTCAGHMVLTDKVFPENGRKKYDPEFSNYISVVLNSEVIFLPWHSDNPKDPNADVYGHADGFIHWAGDNRVFMSNHRDYCPEEADEIKRRLECVGFEVTEMLFDVPNPNMDYNWAYINYLEVGNKIIVPTFGIPEDKQALRYIKKANPDSIVRGFRMKDIAKKGGALHCITWNIRK